MLYVLIDALTLRTQIITDNQEFEAVLEQIACSGTTVDTYAQVSITVAIYNYRMHHTLTTKTRLDAPIVLN